MHVRRFVVDLLDRGESQLLTDIDGDSGMFVKMLKYAEQLGMQDSDWTPSGNALRPWSPCAELPESGCGRCSRAGGSDSDSSVGQEAERLLLFVCVHASDAR